MASQRFGISPVTWQNENAGIFCFGSGDPLYFGIHFHSHLHFIHNEVPEAQQLIDNLLNDCLRKTIEAKESLDKIQQDMINAERVTDGKSTDFTRDQIPEEFLSLEEAQVDLWEAEILLEVLSTIRSGCINDQLNFIIAGSQKIQEPKFGLDLGREKIKQPFAADINISHGQRLKDNLDGRTLEEQNSTPAGWMSSANKLQTLQDELEQLKLENKNLVKNLNTEKTLRKKYCNMVEDLKGKIHVFCRTRPLSKSELTHGSQCIVQSPDEYTVTIKSSHGVKEFQFDQVFDGSTSQEESFRDTNRLIESAVDGYNVCIFAYGQTGSGKTFTMIGEKEPANLGIIPRAFKRIFQIIHENQANFTFKVLTYMLELHNDQLLDLFINPCEGSTTKLEIRKDRKGFVYIQGAEIKEVTSAEMLYALFEQGCTNRHTKTNNENSRSHLIVGVTIKSTNLSDGAVTYGKLSMIDLAGSERAFKTGATDDQLKVTLFHIFISFLSFKSLLIIYDSKIFAKLKPEEPLEEAY
ncbi:uncharacterized protein [Chiloscyllium punctatum]|uniref:uncharacterized protein n=1 Tax=Chiloscyllium punctatum TaxID=137246 RepID=UPI003B6324B0